MEQRGQFSEVYKIIVSARERAFHAINAELIRLYWLVGEYISQRLETEEWGKGVVDLLAEYIQECDPELKGFSARNLRRMRQFYEIYPDFSIWSPLVTKLSWTNNLVILSRSKSTEEREYYLRTSIREKYSKRELDRQISACAFERAMLAGPGIPPAVKEIHPTADSHFKDAYVFDFLNLPESHSEKDLQQAIIANLRQFILELGKDFAFIGQEYRLQVGNSDFFIDLLFYHRDLQCLVAFELKLDKFMPEHLGKMNFYLEALDREVRKPHENPSVGVILCKEQDNEVVEFAMSRSMSPTLVAEYQTKLIKKEKLETKLHQLFEMRQQLEKAG